MSKLEVFLNDKLMPVASRLQQNKVLAALMEGFIRTSPITLGIALPIGDLCLIYPSYSGHILLSLRYKELQRGIEDFSLIKNAEKVNEEAVSKIIKDFLKIEEPAEWMLDSHNSNPLVFKQDYKAYDKLREDLIQVINSK